MVTAYSAPIEAIVLTLFSLPSSDAEGGVVCLAANKIRKGA